MADIYESLVWVIDITTGATTVCSQTLEMSEVYYFTQMGINGLSVGQDECLYFTNSDLKPVYCLPLDPEACGSDSAPDPRVGGQLGGHSPLLIHDFTIGRDGTI